MLISKVGLSADFYYSFLFYSVSLASRLLCNFIMLSFVLWKLVNFSSIRSVGVGCILMKRTKPLDGCHFYCFLNESQKCEAPISGDGCINTAVRNVAGMHMEMQAGISSEIHYTYMLQYGEYHRIKQPACTAAVKTLLHYIFKTAQVGHW